MKEILSRGANVSKEDKSGRKTLEYFTEGIKNKVNKSDEDNLEKLKECIVMFIKGGVKKEEILEEFNKINGVDVELKKYLVGVVNDININSGDFTKGEVSHISREVVNSTIGKVKNDK